jgi:exodeoxyribonuclease-3
MKNWKLVSWNVNGIRAVAQKNFDESMAALAPDVMGIQETKAQDDQVRAALWGLDGMADYEVYTSSAVKKGYSGTAILTRVKPLQVMEGIGDEAHDDEGRVLTAEFDGFFFVTVYTPNSSSGLKRLPYRQEWDVAFRQFVAQLDAQKPVVVCGDLNVAHQEIDLARPKSNYNKTPGYTQDEIDGMTALLTELSLVDTWRAAHPSGVKYSWWSYRGGAREKNVGWRLDYMLISDRLKEAVQDTEIHNETTGSDHCPVSILLQL